MRTEIVSIAPLDPSTALDLGNAVRVTARFIIEAHGDPHLISPDFTFVVRGQANIAAAYRAAGRPFPQRRGALEQGQRPEDTNP